MKNLMKIWFCNRCRNLVASHWDSQPTACPYCHHNDFSFVKPIFGNLEKTAVPIEELTIGDKKYRIIKDIGSGGFGTVYLVTTTIGHTTYYYALKVPNNFSEVVYAVRKKHSLSEHNYTKLSSQNKSILNEVSVFSKYQIPAMMPIIDFGEFSYGEYTINFFVQELGYISLHQLFDFLSAKNKKLSPGLRYALAYEIVKAVAEAHKMNIVLHDLSTENIVLYVNNNGGIYPGLIDFGGAKTKTMSLSLGVYREQYLPTSYQTETKPIRDVFNLGVLVFEILAGVSSWVRLHAEDGYIASAVINVALNSFDEHVLNKFDHLLQEIPESGKILAILKKATSIDKSSIYQSAVEMLKDLPEPTWELKKSFMQKKIYWKFLLKDILQGEKTLQVFNIDKYVENDKIEVKNVAAITSQQYSLRLPFQSSIIKTENNRTIRLDFEEAGLQILNQLDTLVALEFDLFLEG